MTQLTVIPVHVGFGNSETTDVRMLKVVFRLNECWFRIELDEAIFIMRKDPCAFVIAEY
jgi:hypothetical protein